MKRATANAEAMTSGMGLQAWFASLQSSKTAQAMPKKIKRAQLVYILQNLSTLVENGVSLPKALYAIAREQTMAKYAPMLDAIRRKVETGETFSSALASFPDTFSDLMVNQIRVGERSGTLTDTLAQVTAQQEQQNELRAHILKKLAYPVALIILGTGVITFMLIFVIPVFEETYADAKIPLPLITRFLIGVGSFVTSYYWIFLLGGAVILLSVKQLRRNPEMALQMDRQLLRIPLLGNWLRDMAVLQLMEVLGNLMEAGFLLSEALGVSATSVGNRAVHKSVLALQAAVNRGERFSRELERHGEMFPPVVSQLVIVGEQTGKLAKSAGHIRDHLRREILRKTNLIVGTIEPLLTISLAAAIAVILLAIYLPMFDMIGTVAN